MSITNILSFGLTLIWISCVEAGLPLLYDNSIGESDEITAGCVLGETKHRFEEKWHPILEPQGVMYCIVCTCLPRIKKGRLMTKGKVTCENIKHKCPELTCDNAVLVPDQCCKFCPGDDHDKYNPTSFGKGKLTHADVYTPVEDTELFSAMLVDSSMANATQSGGFGRGNFLLAGQYLHYMVDFTGVRRATTFEIKDDQGTLLLRKNISPSKGKYKKLCGTWDHMPGLYAGYLREGKLRATLSSSYHVDGGISGMIATHRALRDETFSALLLSEDGGLARGIAHLSFNSDESSLSFIVQHLQLSDKQDDFTTFVIKLEKGRKVLHQRTLRVNSKEGEFSEIWTSLSKAESRQLARGKLQIQISTLRGNAVRGHITPKTNCGGFQAVMSSSGVQNHKCQSKANGIGGSAFFELLPNGKLHYQIDVIGGSEKISTLSFQTLSQRDKKETLFNIEIEAQEGKTAKPKDGKANDIYKKLTAKTIQTISQNQLYVYAGSESCPHLIGGQIKVFLPSDKINPTQDAPVVLSGSGVIPPTESRAAGQAWLSIDSSCVLHYDILLQGLDPKDTGVLIPILVKSRKEKKGKKGKKQSKASWRKEILRLEEFVGPRSQGQIQPLSSYVRQQLGGNQVYLTIATKSKKGGEIAGKVKISNNCKEAVEGSEMNQINSLMDVSRIGHNMLNDGDDSKPSIPSNDKKCRLNGLKYSDGDSFRGQDGCVMCSCERGRVVCQNPLCPSLNCDHPQQMEGECCPQCIEDFSSTGNSSIGREKSCYFEGDQRWHRFGTRWHPYVPPFGFVSCAICECRGDDGAVKCKKTECPPLRCDESLAVRKSNSDCCKTCPETQDTESYEEESPQDDESPDVNSCHYRGHYFKEGDQWHPRLLPYGSEKCVTCTCANRSVQCHREKCPKLNCRKKIRSQGECCASCDDTRPNSKGTKKGRRKTRRN